jgi:hypothetical protein
MFFNIHYPLSTINYQLSTMHYQLPTTTHYSGEFLNQLLKNLQNANILA